MPSVVSVSKPVGETIHHQLLYLHCLLHCLMNPSLQFEWMMLFSSVSAEIPFSFAVMIWALMLSPPYIAWLRFGNIVLKIANWHGS